MGFCSVDWRPQESPDLGPYKLSCQPPGAQAQPAESRGLGPLPPRTDPVTRSHPLPHSWGPPRAGTLQTRISSVWKPQVRRYQRGKNHLYTFKTSKRVTESNTPGHQSRWRHVRPSCRRHRYTRSP